MRVLTLVFIASLGCGKKQRDQPTSEVVSNQAPMGVHTQAGEPAEPSAPAAPAPAGGMAGKVLERIDAASYSYLRLQTSAGEVWAAVPESTVAVGADVTIENPMPMEGFESKTLNRTFDRIYFGTLGGAGAAAGGQAPAPRKQLPPLAPSAPSAPTAGDAKVAKAAGANGRTVGEIYAGAAALKDKPVEVRGKVVKVANGIMGKNWLHLRDGSGSDAAKSNDLTVTSQDTAAIGDVVLVKGTVRLDKDFGAGYLYPVIIEDATVSK